MKIKFLPLLAVLLILLLPSCLPPEENSGVPPVPESEYSAVLMTRAELEKSIKLIQPRAITNPGKIYIYNHLLFINERYRGVHIYDNSDPKNPIALGFITVPGTVDLAVDKTYMYVDNAVDLVTLQYDGTTLTEVDRDRNIFPELTPPDGKSIPTKYLQVNRPENSIIVRWE